MMTCRRNFGVESSGLRQGFMHFASDSLIEPKLSIRGAQHFLLAGKIH